MSTLHIVNRSPARSDAATACLAVLHSGDGLLLIEDGVLAILGDLLHRAPENARIMMLEADAAARGIATRHPHSVERIDYAGFVAACAAHDRVVTWT